MIPKLQDGLNDRSSEKLMSMLKNLLLKEQNEWRPVIYSRDRSKCKTLNYEIGSEERDAIARWLFKVHLKFGLAPETFSASLTILDRFLLLIRAHPKYLRCIAITCYFLAAKCTEEDEVLPLTSDLVQTSLCGCSCSEVLRMERTIMSKLQWNLGGCTALDFLHVLHACLALHPLASKWPSRIRHLLSVLILKWFACSCNHAVLAFRPSTIAVALISLELGLHTHDWLAVTILLQKLTALDNQELIRCREIVSQALALDGRFQRSGFAEQELSKASTKRKADPSETDDDIYEGIKRLYGEDSSHADIKLSCGSQVILSANFLQLQVCVPV